MKIEIKVFTDYPTGISETLFEKAECGSFESAAEQLGKMERRYEHEQLTNERDGEPENGGHVEDRPVNERLETEKFEEMKNNL